MERRLRKERNRLRLLTDVIQYWKDGRSEWYLGHQMKFYNGTGSEVEKFRQDIEEEVFNILKTRYEKLLKEHSQRLDEIEERIWEEAKFENVENRLWSMLDTWEKMYPESVKKKHALQKLAGDGQNVHTRIVTKQTNTSMDIINSTTVPKGQRTTDEIITHWSNSLGLDWQDINTVYLDMLEWGAKTTIYKPDDYYYRKTLRGLWALIKTYSGDEFKEILKRLFEECQESVGMCGQGHITRLCNVLVGFHSAFLTVQSSMEQFQTKIAALAADESLSTQTKLKEATVLLDEYDIPDNQRQAWIDAF